MTAVTDNCSKHGHPEFSLICDDASVYGPRVKWLLDWLQDGVSQGKRFLPEQTVQVGWSLLKVKPRADGTLALFEPDFKSVPAKFVDKVSLTLLHLTIQKSVNESLGLEDEIMLPSLQHRAIICTNFGIGDNLFLSRTNPSGNDSGWFLGCAKATHDHQDSMNLRPISLYEAAVNFNIAIIPYLGLPPGISISFDGSTPRFYLEKKELSFKADSYLDKKISQQKTNESKETD